ncbi:fungal-specific transcription factor domain-containing protein [Hypomontagnella submonticulosa]|nr:fungal-specific transcription factor domain-containing protein [Hypomontagnella submonticulosa]
MELSGKANECQNLGAHGSMPPSKPLSCTNCRARKLKCSREHPCSHCVRSGAECVFPTRKRIRKPRTTKNSELLQRLSRLESIVGKVGLANLEGGESTAASTPAPSAGSAGPSTTHATLEGAMNQATISGTQDDWKKALQDSKASRYLSGEFWSSLCLEVEGLRQALEQSTSSDDEGQPPQGATPDSIANDSSSASALSPGTLLGSSSRSSYESIEHPSPEHIRFLTATFFTNVDMILKILHRPTIQAALLAHADAPAYARPPLSPESEALFFSIYHAAVASLSSAACQTHLGRRRDDLLRGYAAAVEHLLARADYLNSSSLETLQALTLYVACVRCGAGGSRASWALLSLPIRLAQALDLHHEAANAHLSPYEAELRRRLWWQLIVLDIRASEDRGTTTVSARGSYDTRLPLNINDADFGPASPGPLVERQGPTDVTFSLSTARCSGLFLSIEHAQDAPGIDDGTGAGGSGGQPSKGVEEAVKHAQSLEEQFVKTADPNHAPSYLGSIMVRLVILKMWLIMQYPVHPRRKGGSGSPSSRPGVGAVPGMGRPGGSMFPHEATLRTAISIMELNEYLQSFERFRWWADTYVQWHPLAVALAELCTHTRGETVDRAWRTIDDVFPRWSEVIADTKSGTLWRPIRKLYKKAKAARLAATDTTGAAATIPAAAFAMAPTAGVSLPTPTFNTPAAAAAPAAATPGTAGGTTGGSIAATNTYDTPMSETTTASTTVPDTTIHVRSGDLRTSGLAFGVSLGGGYHGILTQPGQYAADIQQSREPSVPPDLNKLSTSPYALNESMWGWRDLNFDMPMLDIGGPTIMTDWSTWDDFVTETQADADDRSKSGSSEMSN